MKKIWVYDLETLDIFTATFLHRDSDNKRTFIISKSKDERVQLFKFLNEEVAGLIGYNCLHFDAQVLEFLFRNPKVTVEEIRKYAEVITSNNDRRADVPEWRLKIPHLDLFKINHFDNKNRRVSLKWCEFGMDLDNIEDLPSQGEGSNWEEMVLSYNLNDCIATKELYKRTIPMIELRKKLKSLYNINCLNYSNTKLGSEILLKLYCKKTDKLENDIRSLRTKRDVMYGKDILFNYISFKSEEFNRIKNIFYNKVITSTKGGDEISIVYKGLEFVYGNGGIHASLKNKIVESDENNIIIDADVSSLYPNIAIANRLYPEHLGEEFCDVYKNDIVDVRLREKHKKENGDKAIVDGFKEAANATYGNSNQEHSWLYDPLYTMKTTINGQLIISMLCEQLLEIPNLIIIQANTDGITVKLSKNNLEQYHSICNDWMKLTKWELEFAEYSKMIIRDVNNYIAVYTNGKTKCKGTFEFENLPLHKDKSHNIIPIAMYNYFVKGIPIEDTIYNHRNIFDFCAGVRAKKSDKKGYSRYELHYLKDGELIKQKLSKTVRYFISKKGAYLMKLYENNSIEHVEAPKKIGKYQKDWKVTYFNKKFEVEDFKDYNIDYSYYISKAREQIYEIEDKSQLTINF